MMSGRIIRGGPTVNSLVIDINGKEVIYHRTHTHKGRYTAIIGFDFYGERKCLGVQYTAKESPHFVARETLIKAASEIIEANHVSR